ncbi:putative peroxidase-related enzyme [Devosia sp. LC5]|uniref:carboxymuconolactone decarboxylase family protein n=1 Tax=Devosia sp. LC5 TaxID=1502724 RepID=UPI0004E38C00|nr:carboxymuconolactone decarboxylase family protein [Devosia sp. LC5]KFC70616.1 putative peroxidase-related enzyme [Devosia sp. LC5]
MSRLPLIEENPGSPAGKLLTETRMQLGRVPNLYRALANSPAALNGYLQFRRALQAGGLSPKLREQIALVTAEVNRCEYCVSAHAFRGSKLGIPDAELDLNRKGGSSDPKVAAALTLAMEVTCNRGKIADDALDAARAAGLSDEELAELIAHVALNFYSNILNHVAEPELDFPRTPLLDD